MLKILVLIFLFSSSHWIVAQDLKTIVIVDFVKVKNEKKKEAIFYYENNWKLYRDAMLKEGFIKSYRLLEVKADSTGNFDLILMTEYKDSIDFKKSEERFEAVMKTNRPNGVLLLNEKKPAEFRQNVFVKFGETVFSSDKIRKKRHGK
ncbi:MAG: hypothetical protein H7Y04_14130 [Verrucomicrobia bacterium]|nr:hypothetical protein [Cytophagales bacterium]